MEVALARAIMDGAVVAFVSLPVLIAQLPEDLRVPVRQAFDAHSPFDESVGFFVAHVRTDDGIDGQWGIAKCTGAHKGYWVIVASNEARYCSAIQQIRGR